MRKRAMCPLCQKTVLSLRGQDDGFETFIFKNDDREIFDNKIFGDIHLKCLIDSKFAAECVERIAEHSSEVLRLRKIYKSAKVEIFENVNYRSISVLERRGYMCDFRLHNFKNKVVKEKFMLIPISHEYNWPVDNMVLLNDINNCLSAGKSFPLYDFVIGMGVEDRLLYPPSNY